MGTSEVGAPSKSEKAFSPALEQTNINAYPNWAAIQAYYGPGVTPPPPYFNSVITSGHPPYPYMWGTPQPMLPPYGTPYMAIYANGSFYAYPSVPLGSHSQGHGDSSSLAVSEAMVATPLSVETPAKSSSSKDRDLMKKLKGFNGLAVSKGNGNSGSTEVSQSLDCRREGSSDASDGNTAAGWDQNQRKRSCKGVPSTGKDEKVGTQVSTVFRGEANVASSRSLVVPMASTGVTEKPVGTVPSSGGKVKTIATMFPPSSGLEVLAHDNFPSEVWIKDEQELKRERRKLSNRESARRSRLRKQAETEELAVTVESLSADNLALKSEISQLTQNSEKLRLENAAIMEKLKNAHLELPGGTVSIKMEVDGPPSITAENFLSRATHENSKSGTKLHQLLETSTRANAAVAG